MNYGRAVRLGRALRELSQRDLATRAGLTPGYISLIEKNLRSPSSSTQETLARSLGIPSYIMALFGASAEELRGVTPDRAQLVGIELLKLLALGGDENLPLFEQKAQT